MTRNHFFKTMTSPHFQGDHYKNSPARNMESKIESFFKKIFKKNNVSDSINLFKQIRRADCLTFEQFDEKYNIETAHEIVKVKDGSNQWGPGIQYNNDKYPSSNGYQVCSLKHMDMICDMLANIRNISEYQFIDVGSGKGKMLFYNAIKNRPFKSYLGIEIDTDLHNAAEKNLKNINIKLEKEISFVNENALEYKFNNEPKILFFFRPVNAELYRQIILNNKDSIKNSKTVIVVFCPYSYEIISPELEIGLSLYDRSDQAINIYVSDLV